MIQVEFVYPKRRPKSAVGDVLAAYRNKRVRIGTHKVVGVTLIADPAAISNAKDIARFEAAGLLLVKLLPSASEAVHAALTEARKLINRTEELLTVNKEDAPPPPVDTAVMETAAPAAAQAEELPEPAVDTVAAAAVEEEAAPAAAEPAAEEAVADVAAEKAVEEPVVEPVVDDAPADISSDTPAVAAEPAPAAVAVAPAAVKRLVPVRRR